jgi:hypothetical protein
MTRLEHKAHIEIIFNIQFIPLPFTIKNPIPLNVQGNNHFHSENYMKRAQYVDRMQNFLQLKEMVFMSRPIAVL